MGQRHKADALFSETLEQPPESPSLNTSRIVLTIAFHPDLSRIGEEAELVASAENRLSRTEPRFSNPRGSEPWPIADPYVSRRALSVRIDGPDLTLRRGPDDMAVSVDGTPVERELQISRSALERGAVLELAGRVLLIARTRAPARPSVQDLELVGESDQLEEVRRQVLQIADLSVPTLLLGETGTGKELVAEAIHATSRRANRPFVSVNVAAIAPSVAASELFGHRKGAFTGAASDRLGLFGRADGGTIFLDEVGELPIDVQVMLLRTLESGQIQPVGSADTETVDVRVIAATDANLDALVSAQRFRAALFHRLSGYEIHIPPLRERRDDLGRLLASFLRTELETTGDLETVRTRADAARPWLSLEVVRPFFSYSWPGNVRELRNAARQLVVANRGAERATLPASLARTMAPSEQAPSPDLPAPASPSGLPRGRRRKPSEIDDDELFAALKTHGFNVHATSEHLGITRPSLYMLIEKSKRLRKASDLSAAEIRQAHTEAKGDLAEMAERLEVSPRGLRLRLGPLGLDDE